MKSSIKIAIIFLGIVSTASAQFRWSHSKWSSQSGTWLEYDKVEHFYGSTVMYGLFYLNNKSAKESLVASVAFSIAWELKDALVYYEDAGGWGGEGFCWKDLTMDICGILLMHWVAIGYGKVKAQIDQ